MNLDARLKKVEEQARERVRADFCLCILDHEFDAAICEYLSARDCEYEPESSCVVERACPICFLTWEHNLGFLDDEERDVWRRLSDFAREGWDYKRRTRETPEVPEEITSLAKWLRARQRAKGERIFGKHLHGAFLFAARRTKELFPFAVEWIDEKLRDHEEAGVEVNGYKWKP